MSMSSSMLLLLRGHDHVNDPLLVVLFSSCIPGPDRR